MSCRLIHDEDGNEFIDGAIRDITSQKEAEMKLLESRNFIENVINIVPAPVYVKDSNQRLVLCNDAFLKLFDKKREHLVGKSSVEYLNVPKKEQQLYRKRDEEVIRKGRMTFHEEKYRDSRGKWQEVITFRSRFVNKAREAFIIGAEMDITELKRKEQQVLAANAQLTGIINSTSDSIFAIDKNFNYIAFNRNHHKMSRLLQHADIKVGDNIIEVLKKTGDDKWLKKCFVRALKGEPHVIEKVLDYAGFRNKAHSFSFNPIWKSKKEVVGVAIFIRDITAYKEIQNALVASNAHLNAVLESTKDQVFSVDKEKKYIGFNSSHINAMKSIGQNIKEGQSVFHYFKDKGLRKQALAIHRKAIKGKSSTEFFQIKTAGEKLQHFEGTGYPIVDERGDITGVATFFRNITPYKKIEATLRELNIELALQNDELAEREDKLKRTLNELSDRNFELDQLMYKTSHDLRSPLSSILGLVNLSRLDPDKENQPVYISKVEDRIKKLDDFIKSMLNYAKVNRGDVEIKRINLNKLIKGTIQSLEYLDTFNRIQTQFKQAGDNSEFYSDPTFTNIIISNIISNAYKYYDSGKESYLKINVSFTGSKVNLMFKDNGIGIHEKYMSRIFNMFFRGTDKQEGSGLGMYIVKQAVEKLGGKIELKSEFGSGTEVHVSLPNLILKSHAPQS
jgi:PAS domain S-box-containing protein